MMEGLSIHYDFSNMGRIPGQSKQSSYTSRVMNIFDLDVYIDSELTLGGTWTWETYLLIPFFAIAQQLMQVCVSPCMRHQDQITSCFGTRDKPSKPWETPLRLGEKLCISGRRMVGLSQPHWGLSPRPLSCHCVGENQRIDFNYSQVILLSSPENWSW